MSLWSIISCKFIGSNNHHGYLHIYGCNSEILSSRHQGNALTYSHQSQLAKKVKCPTTLNHVTVCALMVPTHIPASQCIDCNLVSWDCWTTLIQQLRTQSYTACNILQILSYQNSWNTQSKYSVKGWANSSIQATERVVSLWRCKVLSITY